MLCSTSFYCLHYFTAVHFGSVKTYKSRSNKSYMSSFSLFIIEPEAWIIFVNVLNETSHETWIWILILKINIQAILKRIYEYYYNNKSCCKVHLTFEIF